MNILYKYYSDLPLSYFDDPSLKLSQPKYLNDPFESNIQNGIIQSDSIVRKKLAILEQKKGRAVADKVIIRNIYDLLNSSGVVSLSETQRNILMWAHYANQHHGLCIGYHRDPFDFKNTPPKKSKGLYYKLHKISYDTSRYDPLSDEFNNDYTFRWTHSVVRKVLTTKSDEWIYEKEHRYIHPISESDYFTTNGLLRHDEYTREMYNSYRPTKIISIDGTKRTHELKADTPYMSEYLKDLQRLNKEIMFYKKINPKKISSIYLGYRYPKEKQELLIKKMQHQECKIKHVKIFKMDICPMEFRLIPKQIFPTSK